MLNRLFKRKQHKAASAKAPQGQAQKASPVPEPTTPSEPRLSPEQITPALGSEKLVNLALNAPGVREREAAVNALDDEETLQKVARESKGRDKAAYQAARAKLQQQRQAQQAREQRTEDLNRLVESLEKHAASQDEKLFEARLEALESRWHPLVEHAAPEHLERWAAALQRCREKLSAIRLAEQAEAERRARAEERQQTLLLLQNTLEDLRQADPQREPDLPALDALQKTQENRWLEATRDTPVEASEQKRYEQQMRALKGYINAVRRFAAEKPGLEQTLEAEASDSDAGQHLSETLDRIDWPETFPMPGLLREAEKHLGKTRRQAQETTQAGKATRQTLESRLDALEQALEADLLKQSRRLLREAQRLAGDMPESALRPLKTRLGSLAARVQELADWAGFATRPKLEELCQAMEHLAGQHMEPETKATHIRELQDQWKALGGTPDQTLWHRFQAASDAAFAPCQAYFEARDELKQANLERRRKICEELEQLLTHTDWAQCDWKGLEKIHRQARREWSEAKPVDPRANRPLQKQFNSLLRTLDEHLDRERETNEARKAEIVRRAEALVDHEPLAEATEGAKALQREWRAIGITRHKKDRELWQAFRTACDAIFARRDRQQAEKQAELEQALASGRDLLRRLEALVESPEPDARGLATLKSEFQALTLPPREAAELRQRFSALIQEAEKRIQSHKLAKRIADWEQKLKTVPRASETIEPVRDWTIQGEILAGVDSPEPDRERRMALQVQRLKQGMQGQAATGDSLEAMEEVIEQWCQAANEGAPPVDQERLLAAARAFAEQQTS